MNSKQELKAKTAYNKLRQGLDALEELVWLFDSNRGSAIKALPALLKNQLETSSSLSAAAGQYASPNPNRHFLIGVLPRLFQDINLFPSNEDIAEFAQSVLHVEIKRYEKRSKYELIGLIVCRANELDEKGLSSLVRTLAHITGSQEKLARVVEARKLTGVSWNEAIQLIGQTIDDERE